MDIIRRDRVPITICNLAVEYVVNLSLDIITKKRYPIFRVTHDAKLEWMVFVKMYFISLMVLEGFVFSQPCCNT